MSEKKPVKTGRKPKQPSENGELVANALTTTAIAEVEKDDPYEGLTDRQKTIARLRLRGLTQATIATVLGVSQPMISKELIKIREHMQNRGAAIDQAVTVGETATLYEEVEHRAWEIYVSEQDSSTKLKALTTVMTAREKHTKLLMDLGRLERAGNKSQVEVTVSPLIESWDSSKKKEAIEAIVKTQLSQLEAPVPPEPDDIQDAILVDHDEED